MLKFFKVMEEPDDDDNENEDYIEMEAIHQKENNSLEKICIANQKNELISVIYNQLYERDPYFSRFEVNRYISQFVHDMENLRTLNHHFNRFVIWSLFDCLKNSSNRFSFIGNALKEFNLMCYGAKILGPFCDRYWKEDTKDKLDNAVIEKIIEIWELNNATD